MGSNLPVVFVFFVFCLGAYAGHSFGRFRAADEFCPALIAAGADTLAVIVEFEDCREFLLDGDEG